eukprot:2140698-Amphidinium_carterae.1
MAIHGKLGSFVASHLLPVKDWVVGEELRGSGVSSFLGMLRGGAGCFGKPLAIAVAKRTGRLVHEVVGICSNVFSRSRAGCPLVILVEL